MAQRLGNVAVGTALKLKESGKPVNYLVVNQGKPSSVYDESCSGTWLLRQGLIEKMVWNNTGSTALEKSSIHSWLNTDMLAKYEAGIQNVIKQVKIPYYANGNIGPLKTGVFSVK